MYINFGTFVGNMAKGYVKEQVRRKGMELIDRMIKNNINKPYYIDDYKVYKSDKKLYSIKDLDRDLKVVNRFIKTCKSPNVLKIVKTVNMVNNRVDSVKDRYNIKEVQKHIKVNYFDKLLFDISQSRDGIINMDTLKKDAKSIIMAKHGNNKISNEIYENFLNYVYARQYTLTKIGLLNKKDVGVYQVTDKLYEALKNNDLLKKDYDFKSKPVKPFKFSYADVSIFRMIDQHKGSLSIDDIKSKYTDEAKQKMIIGRIKKLEYNGFLEFKNNVYIKTESGKEEIKKFLTKKDKANDIKISSFDKGILKDALNSLGLEEKKEYYINKYPDSKTEADRMIKIYESRCKKLADAGYLDKVEDGYRITEKGLDVLNKRDNIEKIETKNIINSLSSFDKHILKLSVDGIDLDERKEFFINRYKDNEKEIIRQLNMLYSRCMKLESAGYLIKTDNGYRISDLGLSALNNKDTHEKVKDNIKRNESYNKYKITKFDLDNIAKYSVDGYWSRDYYKNSNPGLSSSLLEKKLISIEKRFETLVEMKLAEEHKDGYILYDDFFHRVKLVNEKGINKFSPEQKEIVNTLSTFLNLSDKQISSFIYKDKDILCNSELKYLVDKGYLGVVSRDLKCDGDFTKVYYLTSAGKKAASHLTGVKVDKIFSSKLHNRPEELRHDILVYSAYKDIEDKLRKENCIITSLMTDKQMRSYDMSNVGKQRVEYSDLYIEFLDSNTNEKGYINIEVDCGYKASVIKSKAENIDNLIWYTDSEKQAEKINKIISNAKVFTLNF